MKNVKGMQNGNMKVFFVIIAYLFLTVLGSVESSGVVMVLSSAILLALVIKIDSILKSNLIILLGLFVVEMVGGSELCIYTGVTLYIPIAIAGFWMKNEHIFMLRRNKIFRGSMFLKENKKIFSLSTKIISTMPLLGLILFTSLGYMGYVYYLKMGQGVDILNQLKSGINEVMAYYSSHLPVDSYNEMSKSGAFDILKDIGAIWPILVFSKYVIVSLFLYYVSIWILNSYFGEGYLYPTFDNIFFPYRPAYFLLLLPIVFFMGDARILGLDIVNIIENFVYLVFLLLFLEGLSFIIFYIRFRKMFNLPSNTIVFGVFFILLVGVIPGIVTFGFFDNVMNLRVRLFSNVDNFGGKDDR